MKKVDRICCIKGKRNRQNGSKQKRGNFVHNGSVCEEKRKSEYRKGATYKYALLKAKSLSKNGTC